MSVAAMFLAVMAALVVSGCGLSPVQKSQVATFGSAADAVGALSATQFSQLRQDIIQMNTEYLLLEDGARPEEFEFDTPLSADDAQKRVLAVNALRSYGDTLNKLVTADESGPINAAATSLISNFDAAASAKLTAAQQAAGANLITMIGGLLAEEQKKKAVGEIVSSYACAVDQLAALLQVDFVNFGDSAGTGTAPAPVGCPQIATQSTGVLYGYEVVAGRLKNRAKGVLAKGDKIGFQRRQQALNDYILAVQQDAKARQIGTAGMKAIADLRRANARLLEVLKDDKLTVQEIKDFGASIKQLVALVKVLTNS